MLYLAELQHANYLNHGGYIFYHLCVNLFVYVFVTRIMEKMPDRFALKFLPEVGLDQNVDWLKILEVIQIVIWISTILMIWCLNDQSSRI